MAENLLKHLNLGATMYMPALHSSVVEVGNALKYEHLRSVIFCTEDSVADPDLPLALANLARCLPQLKPVALKRFIRPRNLEILKTILNFEAIDKIDGFILPKVDLENLPKYFSIFEQYDRFEIMLTLETEIAFDLGQLYSLRSLLLKSPLRGRILALRIGVMDLLSRLGLRREDNQTIYDTPLGYVIDQLITVFRPFGFPLTAPVCEYFSSPELLKRELALDIGRGLYSKTAIHPDQVPLINGAYQVSQDDLTMAKAINDPKQPAVFRLGSRMCEKAVHNNWAATIEARALIFGTLPAREI